MIIFKRERDFKRTISNNMYKINERYCIKYIIIFCGGEKYQFSVVVDGVIQVWFLSFWDCIIKIINATIKVDEMDVYVYCLIGLQYDSFVRTIIDYINKHLNEKVEYKKNYSDGQDYIGCSLFSMYIESTHNSDERDLDFTKSEYDIETDVSAYINLFTDTINPGIEFILGLVNDIEREYKCNVIVQDHSSKAVYMKSEDKDYCDQEFWEK